MSAKSIKAALQAKPFVPFEITTADGKVIPVKGPGLVSFTPSEQRILICEGARCHVLSANQPVTVRSLPGPDVH